MTAFLQSKAGIVFIIVAGVVLLACIGCSSLLALSMINPTP